MVDFDPLSFREYTLTAGRRYFRDGGSHILALDLPCSSAAPTFSFVAVGLPSWAADLGVGAPPVLIVDSCCVVPGNGPVFKRCDWLRAAHLHLSGWLERSVEDKCGSIQSYAFRLPGEWSRAYEHAWVNRIYLFLRRLASRCLDRSETEMFGARPEARFILSHDVDALTKTTQMRIKTSAMSIIATARHLLGGRVGSAADRMQSGVAYALRSSDYWLFDEVCAAEAARGFRSVFMFADQKGNRGFVSWLMDPSYRATDPHIAALIRRLHNGGWQIGIHPGFNTWNDARRLGNTRSEVSAALGQPVELCRQHWLRFSWKDTWVAQAAAGIKVDFTLCFNDRPGFRNGAAIRHRPWNSEAGRPHDLESIPTVIMDSHFYDYAFPEDPGAAMAPWVDEVIAVGGEASLLWHVHTMHSEFGWGPGYRALLDLLAGRRAIVVGVEVDG